MNGICRIFLQEKMVKIGIKGKMKMVQGKIKIEQEMMNASTKARIDYRKELRHFHTSILSSKASLTRMKPSRRYGFMQMGSCRQFASKILIALDASGSISNDEISDFLSVLYHSFRYGIEELSVISFDTQISGAPKVVTKASDCKTFKVIGRGGSNFQPIFDYIIIHQEYGGFDFY